MSSQTISVPYPLPTPTEDVNWKVAFEKPVNIAIVGSWINNLAVKRKDDEPWVVDVAVEMPSVSISISGVVYIMPIFLATGLVSGKRLHEWSIFPQTGLLPRCNRETCV